MGRLKQWSARPSVPLEWTVEQLETLCQLGGRVFGWTCGVWDVFYRYFVLNVQELCTTHHAKRVRMVALAVGVCAVVLCRRLCSPTLPLSLQRLCLCGDGRVFGCRSVRDGVGALRLRDPRLVCALLHGFHRRHVLLQCQGIDATIGHTFGRTSDPSASDNHHQAQSSKTAHASRA